MRYREGLKREEDKLSVVKGMETMLSSFFRMELKLNTKGSINVLVSSLHVSFYSLFISLFYIILCEPFRKYIYKQNLMRFLMVFVYAKLVLLS